MRVPRGAPSIAQLVERRTVGMWLIVILRSLVRVRLEGGEFLEIAGRTEPSQRIKIFPCSNELDSNSTLR